MFQHDILTLSCVHVRMEGNMESEYEKKLDEAIEIRLIEMEDNNYVFAKRFSMKDYLLTGVVVAVCLIGIILGGYL